MPEIINAARVGNTRGYELWTQLTLQEQVKWQTLFLWRLEGKWESGGIYPLIRHFWNTVDGDEWLASHPGRLTLLGKSNQCLFNRRLGGLQGPIWTFWRTEIPLVPARNRTTIPRTSSPWPSHYTDCVIPVPVWTVILVTFQSTRVTIYTVWVTIVNLSNSYDIPKSQTLFR